MSHCHMSYYVFFLGFVALRAQNRNIVNIKIYLNCPADSQVTFSHTQSPCLVALLHKDVYWAVKPKLWPHPKQHIWSHNFVETRNTLTNVHFVLKISHSYSWQISSKVITCWHWIPSFYVIFTRNLKPIFKSLFWPKHRHYIENGFHLDHEFTWILRTEIWDWGGDFFIFIFSYLLHE